MRQPYEFMMMAEHYRPSPWTRGVALLEATATAMTAGEDIPITRIGAVIEKFPEEHRAFLVRAMEMMTAYRSAGLRLHTGYVSFFGKKPENTWEMWETMLDAQVPVD